MWWSLLTAVKLQIPWRIVIVVHYAVTDMDIVNFPRHSMPLIMFLSMGHITGSLSCRKPACDRHLESVFSLQFSLPYFIGVFKCELPSRTHSFWKHILTHNGTHLEILAVSHQILSFIYDKEWGMFTQTVFQELHIFKTGYLRGPKSTSYQPFAKYLF
jgi:hypothetical protein